MSAYFDSLSGAGYDGSEGGGIGDVAANGAVDANGGGYFSGALQSITALSTGYLARRMDIDLQSRYFNSMPQPALAGNQGRILAVGANGAPLAAATPQGTVLNISAMLPYLLIVGVIYMVARAAK
jgi:hypothetical protein